MIMSGKGVTEAPEVQTRALPRQSFSSPPSVTPNQHKFSHQLPTCVRNVICQRDIILYIPVDSLTTDIMKDRDYGTSSREDARPLLPGSLPSTSLFVPTERRTRKDRGWTIAWTIFYFGTLVAGMIAFLNRSSRVVNAFYSPFPAQYLPMSGS